jgi:YD repeat-containing protein
VIAGSLDSGFFTFRPADGVGGTQINVASGNALVRTRDLADGPLTYHVVVDRFYNSLDPDSYTILSPRWGFDVGPDTKLIVESNQDATVRGPSGYRIRFARQADGSYVAPEGFDGTLVKTPSGWTLSRTSQNDEFGFDGSGALAWTKDAELRDFTVQGTSAAGRTVLSSYGTNSGRRVNLSYTTSGDYFVRLMDDPASGHHWYRYSGGRLSEYESPTGAITSYGYDSNGFLDEIVEPGGTTVALDVAASGKVHSITTTLPGGVPQTTSLVYTRRPYKTDVTAPDATRRTYAYDDDWRVTRDYDPDVVPTVTASGELHDLADDYVGPNRTYPLTVAADQPDGAGLRRLLVERSNGTEIEGEDVPCTATPFDLVCPTQGTANLDVSFVNVPEGEQTIRAAADDDEEHHATSDEWKVLVDKTAPPAPDDLRLQYFDPAETPGPVATIGWNVPDDPMLPDGSEGAGVDRTEVRYGVNGGPKTVWATAPEDAVEVAGLAAGSVVEIEVRSIDAVGNVSTVATGAITVAEQLEDPALLSAGAQAYVAEYGGSPSAGLLWMERQTAFRAQNNGDVGAAVSAEAPGAYGGIWMDNATRRVKIQVTSTTARYAVEDLIDEWAVASFVDVDVVAWTQGQLDATLSDFDSSLQSLLDAGLVMTSRDTATNSVLVEASTDLSAAQELQLQAVAAAAPVTVRIERFGSGVVSFEATSSRCSKNACDGDLRGGIRIRRTTSFGDLVESCTAGFVARDPGGSRHLMTAGHCFKPGDGAVWEQERVTRLPQDIGASGVSEDDSARGDVGLVDLDFQTAGAAFNALLVNYSDGSTFNLRRNARYKIRRSATLQPGAMICFQGQKSGTKCGKNLAVRKSSLNLRAYGFINICTESGDSGGPVFFGGFAYGIVAGNMHPKGKPDECMYGAYTGARTAENLLDVKISG